MSSRLLALCSLILFTVCPPFCPPLQSQAAHPADSTELLKNCNTVLFLGDSITFAGQYVQYFETALRLALPNRSDLQILNLGLSSETVSGLSEEGHAGGKFPRPDLHERLSRVLEKTRPDLIFACYGMNDGIYLPLEDSRFAAFKEGMLRLHKKAEAAGAKIVHLTPPSFDPGPGAKNNGFNYNETLDAYSIWLIEQRSTGWNVIDLHFPMNREIQTRRDAQPDFRFAQDRIHPNSEGHWVMAREILSALALPTEEFTQNPAHTQLVGLIRTRSDLLKLAWLSETGHLRPGVPKGLPLPEADAQAAGIAKQIQSLIETK
jgi:lysophospholipase L1-like esterase